MDRNEIATELLRGVPLESLADHAKIADALRNGESDEYIMNMPEVDRWPETYSWLKSELGV